ncbi:MAG: SRPBCC domain-containing protein [Gemmatimonadaceae bacterium]
MRYVLMVAGILVLIVVVVLVVGWMLPVGHRATSEATYRATPEQVFKLVTDVHSFPQWRPSVKEVEMLPSSDGHARFREIGKNGSILFEIDSVVQNQRLVMRIADRSLPFGGKWTYEIMPRGDSTTLRITEDGEVYNPVFRFVSRFIFGHTATIDEYLKDVGRNLASADGDK